MKYTQELRAANVALTKLNKYSAGLPKGSVATNKYLELNRLANEAIKKLPVYLRTRAMIEFLGSH